jgi:DNA polymerase-3 subunit delta
MKLSVEQLANHLASNQVKSLYWISSDEPLLRNEAADQIRHAAKQLGFDGREKFVIDARFDWQPILTTLQTPSLFAQKQRLELDFTLVKLNKSHTDGLSALLQEIERHPQALADNFILISSQKLEARQAQSAWYKKYLSLGAHLPIWPIARQQLPNWIHSRMQQTGLHSSKAVATALADQIEGNLLAAQQEIEKLALLHHAQPGSAPVEITLSHLEQAISDRAQYSTFDFVDAILAGQVDQALRRLRRLQDTGAEPALILWALTREIRMLLRMQEAARQGRSLNDLFRKERLLPAKQKLVTQANKRLQGQPLTQVLSLCQLVDLAIKGRAKLCPWLGLAQLASGLCRGNFSGINQHLAAETEISAT